MTNVLYLTEDADAPCSLAELLEANLDTFTHEDVAALGWMRPGDVMGFDIGGGVTVVRAVDAHAAQLRAEIARITDVDVVVEEHISYPFGVWAGGSLIGLGRDEVDALEDALVYASKQACGGLTRAQRVCMLHGYDCPDACARGAS